MSVATRRVPCPPPDRHHKLKWPWADMKIGEMFFSPNHPKNTMMTLASTTGKKLGRKFATRLIWMRSTKDGWVIAVEGERRAVQGIGVWRKA